MSVQQTPGTVLDGKYEVLSRLGGGGMGEVYLVRHIHLEEKRVVKILRQDRVTNADAQKRFLREARFATQIKDPHVAILHDYSQLADGSYYMVWEYIEGEDVGSRLRRMGPFAPHEAVDLAIQALQGLSAIHTAGMIHRDISPDNLMIANAGVGERPVLKIIDLGLAKNLGPDPELEVTQDGMFMGKLLYCAPEQAGLVKGEVLDHRTDLYSLGLVLYEMLSGLSPWEAETPQGAIFKRLSEDPLPLGERNPTAPVPPALAQVVLRALAREKEHRFPDAASFIAALERLAKSLSQAATQEIQVPASLTNPRPPVVVAAGPASAQQKEMTRAERLDLLAQIERAASRLREGSQLASQAEALLGGGQLHEAFAVVARLEQENPRASALPALKQRLLEAQRALDAAQPPPPVALPTPAVVVPPLAPAVVAPPPAPVGVPPPPAAPAPLVDLKALADRAREALRAGRLDDAQPLINELATAAPGNPEVAPLRARWKELTEAQAHRARVNEAVEMVRRALKKKQLPLARLAVDTLGELAPEHVELADFRACVEGLAQELDVDREAATALAAGRAALAAGDERGARRIQERLARVAPLVADELEREIEGSSSDKRRATELTNVREQLDRLLQAGKLDAAGAEIDRLAGLGVARVTLDLYRTRLADLRSRSQAESRLASFRRNFDDRVNRGDFQGARQVVGQLQEALPGHALADQLIDEVARLEAAEARRKSVDQAVFQIERFLDANEPAKAELALKLLLQMDPDNRNRKAFERRLAKLRG